MTVAVTHEMLSRTMQGADGGLTQTETLGRPGALGALIHEAVRRVIEVAVEEELTAALGAVRYVIGAGIGFRRACGEGEREGPGLGDRGPSDRMPGRNVKAPSAA